MATQSILPPLASDDTLPTPIFTTPRLIIRPMHPQDAPSMALNGNSPLVAKYMSLQFPHPYTLSDAVSWIEMNRTEPLTNWGIYESSAPDISIGGVGLKLGSEFSAHTAEVGFWIGEQYWGRGYTTEMLEGLTAWLFADEQAAKGITRLFGFVAGENVGSRRCFEKCGYEQEGIMKEHWIKGGQVWDKYMYGLVKGDWEKKRAQP